MEYNYINQEVSRRFRVMMLNVTFNNIVVVSFIGGRNRSAWRKPLTCH
jgi:hypothetical protein